MGIETALGIGLAAAGTAAASYSAVSQNAKAKAAKGEAQKAARVEAGQVRRASDLERLKTMRRGAQIRGRLRLAGAEAGLADFGSIADLDQQAVLDTEQNLDVLEENTVNTEQLIGSRLSNELNRLASSYRNAVLAGVEGGLGGANQGIVLGSNLKDAFPETFGD